MLRLCGDVVLGHPDATGKVGTLSPPGRRALLELLVRGKLPLFCATGAGPKPSRLLFPALAHADLAEPLERELERCDAQRRAFLEAQAVLARAGIEAVLLKSQGAYPYTSSNVDALVPRGTLARAAAALEAAGHHEMTHYWEPHKRLLRKFRGDACEIMMHLHEKVSWTVLSFFDPEELRSRARSTLDPAVRHLAPEHLVALLLAHSVYESSRVSIGDVFKVHVSMAAPGFDVDELTRCADRSHWRPGLLESARWYAAAERALFGRSLLEGARLAPSAPLPRADPTALARGAFALSRPRRWRSMLRKLLRDNPRSAAEKLHDFRGVWRQIGWGRLGLRCRPAALVCVCGIDGAGKSTLVASLARAFEECELPTRRVWMRGGFSRGASAIKAALRSVSARVPGPEDSEGKLRAYRGGRGRWLWAWLIVAEQVALACLAVRLPRVRGHQTLAERYVPDTLVDLAERYDDPSFASRAPGRWLRRLTPVPDLVLWLDLPGEAARARKPDHFDVDTLERRRCLYRSRLEGDPKAIRLDATRPLETLRQQAVDRALAFVLRRIRAENRLARLPRDDYE
jgi:thymidylate kinase